ncbi:endonuclease domain-containing protein [Tsukamurella soli]|uniref:DUF559 domain-containing protein n=1 Tax=Tsukamurella soli TaxID=644556 RepID=A0ABP8JQ37_9ACTN
MEELGRLLADHGGVVSAAQFKSLGYSYDQMKAHGADWRRLRRGWYAHSSADSSVVSAVSAGGVLSCVAALERRGVWIPPGARGRHVRFPKAARSAGARGCKPYRADPPLVGAVDTAAVAVAAAANHVGEEDLIVILDSMVNKGMLEQCDVRDVLSDSPHAHKNLWTRCDGRADSGTETMTRLRLRARGIRLSVQVPIAGVGLVDLLVGRRLVIEVDGEEPHRDRFHSDRTRDRKLRVLGFEPLRLTYHDVVYSWDEVVQDILAMIRRGDHMRPPSIVLGTSANRL